MKVLFMYNRCSKFKESKFPGFPCIWVDVNTEDPVTNQTEKFSFDTKIP